MVETLRKLKEGKQVSIPIYNFHTHSREKQQKAIYGANVIIFEGIMAFAHKSLLELMDMKIFVDTGKLMDERGWNTVVARLSENAKNVKNDL